LHERQSKHTVMKMKHPSVRKTENNSRTVTFMSTWWGPGKPRQKKARDVSEKELVNPGCHRSSTFGEVYICKDQSPHQRNGRSFHGSENPTEERRRPRQTCLQLLKLLKNVYEEGPVTFQVLQRGEMHYVKIQGREEDLLPVRRAITNQTEGMRDRNGSIKN